MEWFLFLFYFIFIVFMIHHFFSPAPCAIWVEIPGGMVADSLSEHTTPLPRTFF